MSANLTDLYRAMHRQGHFPGNSTEKWLPQLTGLAVRHKPVTVLDYGSGKGLQWTRDGLHDRIGIPAPVCYDPGVEEFSNDAVLQQDYDLVICTDVMEHLEGHDLSRAFGDILDITKKAALIAITCRPAKKTLPDGRNCHLTIRPPIWWRGYAAALTDALNRRNPPEILLEFEE